MDMPPIKKKCPTCKGIRNCTILGKKETSIDEDEPFWGWDKYYLLECNGCEGVFFLHEYQFSGMRQPDGTIPTISLYYPQIRTRTLNLDSSGLSFLAFSEFELTLMEEIYSAYNNEMPLLAAMGIRSLLETLAKRLTCEDKQRFDLNIENLSLHEFATKKQLEMIKAVVELGHGAIHRDHIPSMRKISLSLDIVESLMHVYIFNSVKADKIKDGIPLRAGKVK